jgi:tRNA(Ile2) C34 agmatinyltransferase TiaS
MSTHLRKLCALVADGLDVEQARNEYLATLDADEGLAVLLIPAAAIVARPPAPRCDRCGARLSRKRHRCSRCGLRQM